MSAEALVTISSPPRGSDVQTSVQFVPAEVVCTWSWGLQPATALIDWVSATAQPNVIAQAGIQIDLGGHTFYGIIQDVVPVLSTDGHSLMQQFKDSREFLQWDVLKAAFNLRTPRIVNGQFRRRYAHLLPWNHANNIWTYSDTPYTARQILDFCFQAPTTETAWTRTYHAALNNPVYELDWQTGVKLGTAVQAISEKCGLTFTLMGGRYSLVWALKGVGSLPSFPTNSNHRRSGTAVSGNPTRVTLLGERNRYQVLNLELEPDWRPAWEAFYDFNAFVNDLLLHEKTEGAIGTIAANTAYASLANGVGGNLALARAYTITVGEYADLRDARSPGGGSAYRDYRRFSGRSRLQMPVRLYLAEILFRAYRPPLTFQLRNSRGGFVPIQGLDLAGHAVTNVTHDPETGDMSYDATMPSEHNGYAIVQGFQVAADGFKTLRPTYFNLDDWRSNQALWQAMPFHVDNSGEGNQFIIFDEPCIRSGDLLSEIQIGGVTQSYPALRANTAPTAALVRAALTFEAERFQYSAGVVGAKDDVENVSALGGEFIAFADGSVPVEFEYADGQTATYKAAVIVGTLLNRQYTYDYGGWDVPGSNAQQLTPMLDRVTVSLRADGGLTEEVDFTNERARNVAYATVANGSGQPVSVPVLQIEPEREFERRHQLNPLLPGQRELRQEANQLKLAASFLRRNPNQARTLVELFHHLMGLDAMPVRYQLLGDYVANGGLLPAGTPLFRSATARLPQVPDDDDGFSTIEQPVFCGATVVHNEPANAQVRTTATGDGGVILVRVKGPVAVNEAVGMPKDNEDEELGSCRTYLTTAPKLAVGNALEVVSGAVVKYIQVRTNGAGGDEVEVAICTEDGEKTYLLIGHLKEEA